MKTILTSFFLFLAAISFSQQTTWTQVQTNTTTNLNTINFGSDMVGFIGGDDSLLLKTTDGGISWNPVNFTGVSFVPGGEDIVNLKFVTELVGYMTVGPYSGTYQTLDGGMTWTAVTFAGNMCYNQGLFFFDQGNGYVGGSGCFQGEHIERMIFGTMQAVTINTPSWDANDLILDIDFNQMGSIGLAASAGGRIYRTTDSGVTWDSIPAGLPAGVPVTSIELVNDTLAYAGYDDLGTGFGILMTTDGGLTWSQDVNSATFFYPAYHDVHQGQDGNIYAGAEQNMMGGGMILENKGPGWSYYTFDQTIRQLDSYGDSTVFAVGDSGFVVCNLDPQLLSAAENDYGNTALAVYPNPTQNELNVVIPNHLIGKGYTIVVSDLSGKLILQQAVESRVEVSHLEAGMYTIQLISADERYTSKFIKE